MFFFIVVRLLKRFNFYKDMDDDVKSSVQFVSDVVNGKYTAAKKENDFVYHDKIPTLESLPEIKGQRRV